MKHYFVKALGAQLRHAPSLYALSICGVAVGVASVLCIQIINRNALSAFSGSVQAISGEADCSVLGTGPPLDETLYTRVLAHPDVRAAWPVLQVPVTLATEPEVFLDIVGVDFFAPIDLPLLDSSSDMARGALAAPGWIAVSPAFAAEEGWSVGNRFAVNAGSRVVWLEVGALVDFSRGSPLASRKLALMDIAQAQSLLGRRGEIDQIDVQWVDQTDPQAALARLQRDLGPAVAVRTAAERREQVAGLLAAFRLNLTALSAISIFVGVFLIFSSTHAALVRRRNEFGMLRSLGATSTQLLGVVLGEVVLLGLLGTVIGLFLGRWVAQRNMELVSATLTNLYLLNEIERLELPQALLWMGGAVGLGGALAGALLPALDLSRRDTFSLLRPFTLHEKVSRAAPHLALLGSTALLLGSAWFAVDGHHRQPGGFILGAVLLLALPSFTPLVVRTLARAVPVVRLDFTLSCRNLGARLQTTAFAVAALGIAVSMLIGVTLLVGSFRQTLATWVDTTIRADVFVTTPAWSRAGSDATLDDTILDGMRAHPGVAQVELLRQLQVSAGDRKIRLSGLSTQHPQIEARIPLREGVPGDVWRQVREGGACLISEPLSRKEKLARGDSLAITTAYGVVRLPIAGVSYDYSSDGGAALVDLGTLERLFGPGPINNMALYLDAGYEPDRVIDELRARFSTAALLLRSNRQLRQEIFEIFDQTFAITRILQAMALLVAVSGIALTLIVVARERAAELALYHALGALRRQIFGLFVGEGFGIGLLGLAFGAAGGLALAAILMFAINPMYFGWTIRPAWPWLSLGQEAATILGAALLASVYPAFLASVAPARGLSRDDL